MIANNGSTDNTGLVALQLVKQFLNVEYVFIEKAGRGNAVKYSWRKFDADIYAYCDADLATDIKHLNEIFSAIIEEKNNIVIGNRYIKCSQIKRDLSRLIYSKFYIFLVRIFFKTEITDFECGFKAVDKEVVKNIVPKVNDEEWFFDTELLLKAEEAGYKIKQIPIRWNEQRVAESKVVAIKDAFVCLKKLFILRDRGLS